MERKYLFLNNDLSTMLSREHQTKLEMTKEWEEEQKVLYQEAEEIIKNPTECINAKDIMIKSLRYTHTDDCFLKLFIEGTDSEQLKEIQSLEYAASMTLLPEAILIAGAQLIDKEDYERWIVLLNVLHYVPSQKAFCYCLKRHKDFYEVLNVINIKKLNFPQTFLWVFLDHWFEWLTQVGGKLLTYKDKKGFYNNNKDAQALIQEAVTIIDEWNKDIPIMVREIMEGFSRYIQQEKILAWATRKHLRNDVLNNPYSEVYNHYLKLICKYFSENIALNAVADEDLNLNMLILMAETVVINNDITFGKEVYKKLIICLMNDNFSCMEKISAIDEHRQKTISQLLILITPSLNFTPYINEIATRFQGWNLNYHQLYNEAKREAYLICCFFKMFEVNSFNNEKKFFYWKNIIDIYLREYRRCDNEYILRDDFSVPFRVAVEVAEKIKDTQCKEYLHEAIIENVLSIVSLLTIFSECSMSLSHKTVERLKKRIEQEWPSAKILMELRGQTIIKNRIDNLISQLASHNSKE